MMDRHRPRPIATSPHTAERGRLLPGNANEGPHVLWWPAKDLDRLLAKVLAQATPWLVIDPFNRIERAAMPALWVYTPADPKHIAPVLYLAERAFGGALILDTNRLCGLWGAVGPQKRLWAPREDPLRRRFPVLSVRLG